MINLERLRREAKRFKKERGITHTAALDIAARQHGHDTWAALMRALAPQPHTNNKEQAT